MEVSIKFKCRLKQDPDLTPGAAGFPPLFETLPSWTPGFLSPQTPLGMTTVHHPERQRRIAAKRLDTEEQVSR